MVDSRVVYLSSNLQRCQIPNTIMVKQTYGKVATHNLIFFRRETDFFKKMMKKKRVQYRKDKRTSEKEKTDTTKAK